jgi:hypothetical protein
MSASTVHFDAPTTPRASVANLRLLKPAHRSCGFVQGAWWPRSADLDTELPPLLEVLSSRLGHIDCVIYDEMCWAPAPSYIEFRNGVVKLDGSRDHSINTLSVIGEQFGRLNLLVVPFHTGATDAYLSVMAAASPDDISTPDKLLAIGAQEAEKRRQAGIAYQRWESDGGALRRLRHEHDRHAAAPGDREV